MATKRGDDKPKPRKRLTKKQYLARRKKRVAELHNAGLLPREIAEQLVNEGTIETTDESRESAVRLVRDDVKEYREELATERAEDAKVVAGGTEIDALERELLDLREEHARQKLIADGEPTENCKRSGIAVVACANTDCLASGHLPFIGPAIGMTYTNTPQGPMVSYRALWPSGTRQKASKDASILAEKIRHLEITLAEKRKTLERTSRGSSAGAVKDTFEFNFSGKSLDELIDARTGGKAPVN